MKAVLIESNRNLIITQTKLLTTEILPNNFKKSLELLIHTIRIYRTELFLPLSAIVTEQMR